MADRNSQNPDRKQPRKNQVKAARSASSRPTPFYIGLAVLALAGIGALAYVVGRPKPAAQEVSDITTDTTNAGPPQGYSLGNANAPVKILEFGDFECPQCGRFSTLTEPDLRKRLIETGDVFFTYYDFPLQMHKNTRAASNAAACADEQGKFWPMHDKLFDSQDQWNGEATDKPAEVFAKYAGEMGLNAAQWQSCFDSRKYQKRISANEAEALRRNVNATPSFIIGNKLYPGSLGYDELKAIVDSLKAKSPAPAPKT
ncbi:MAG: DsbA family protein [Gemmatimonadaceae bacterium]|nr:DsbA family protein [Gemmatimonadaceae bacterium]